MTARYKYWSRIVFFVLAMTSIENINTTNNNNNKSSRVQCNNKMSPLFEFFRGTVSNLAVLYSIIAHIEKQ